MKKVSIIVATYNRASKIKELYKCVMRQDYCNYELIIVNDGSTDKTIDVLSEFDNPRTKIINTPNRGVSHARNTGIANASGDYIIFIDDDDYIPQDYLSTFTDSKLDHYDLVIDSYSRTSDGEKYTKVNFKPLILNGSKTILNHLLNVMNESPYCFFVHAKRFDKNIIEKNKIKFNENLSIGEDREFILEYLKVASSTIIINKAKYTIIDDCIGYRLSDNKKPICKSWSNIILTFEYLNKLKVEYPDLKLENYITNYLATRIYDYILIPYLLKNKRNKKDKEILKNTISLWKKKLMYKNIKRQDVRNFGRTVEYLGFKIANLLLKTKLYLSTLK